MLYFCFSWLTEITLELCQHVLKLTLWFVCRSCVAIAPVVQFYQEGPFQPAGRYVFNVCLLYDMDAHEFGLLHYAFVDLQGALARQVVHLAILSFLPEVIANPHLIAVMVDLI